MVWTEEDATRPNTPTPPYVPEPRQLSVCVHDNSHSLLYQGLPSNLPNRTNKKQPENEIELNSVAVHSRKAHISTQLLTFSVILILASPLVDLPYMYLYT